jgi:hypothetical protein
MNVVPGTGHLGGSLKSKVAFGMRGKASVFGFKSVLTGVFSSGSATDILLDYST